MGCAVRGVHVTSAASVADGANLAHTWHRGEPDAAWQSRRGAEFLPRRRCKAVAGARSVSFHTQRHGKKCSAETECETTIGSVWRLRRRGGGGGRERKGEECAESRRGGGGSGGGGRLNSPLSCSFNRRRRASTLVYGCWCGALCKDQ